MEEAGPQHLGPSWVPMDLQGLEQQGLDYTARVSLFTFSETGFSEINYSARKSISLGNACVSTY